MEEACIAIIVALATDNANEGRKRKKKQRIWLKEWFLKRTKYTHHNLLDELLLTSNEDYANFLRMDHSTFMELLEKVEPYIKKKDTNMRSSIPANQRLSTTLRYLATGKSFKDLKFTTAIAPQTLSKMKFLKHLGINLKISLKFIHMIRYKTKNFNTISSKFYEISPLKLTSSHQNFIIHRKYCYHFKEDDTDSDNEDVEFKRDIKNIILPNNNDILITKISECKSLQEIFELIQLNKNQLNWENISMAIAMIRELQIIYYRVCTYEKTLNCSEIMEGNFENILTNDDFLNLLDLTEKHFKFMNIQCLSYNILCLHNIGVDLNCKINQKLLQRLKKILMITPVEEIESCILSRFTVSTISRKDLSSLYTIKDIWPIILKKINLCDTYNDLKHISICLYNLPWFLNKSTMDNFVKKVESTLLNKPKNDDKVKCIVKVLRLLNSPYWSTQNINLIRSLLLDLQGTVQNMSIYDMIQIQMIILKQYEPYQLFEEIHNVTTKWLSKVDDDTDITVLRLLSCIVPTSSVSRRKHIELLLRKQFLLNTNFSKLRIGPLFNILRNLKTSDVHICNSYWSSVLHWLNSAKPLQDNHKLLRICNRYMNFNNNMAGTYRHHMFECQMIKWLNEELHQGMSAIIPSKFSKIFTFLISYPNTNIGYDIHEVMVKKVLNNIGQYSIYDCYIVSRGLNIAFLNRKNKTLTIFLDQYVRLCTALNKRCLDILDQEPNLNINQLNSLFRGYNHRTNIKEPELFYKILDRYKHFTYKDFSSRTIKELTHNLVISDSYDAQLLDKCLEYCTINYKYLLAENVEKILSLFFSFGINSEKFIEFLTYATEIINRDKLKMSGLNFMRASLALCYFHSLPTSITNYLFSVEFLEKLDDELNNCYSKTTYALKVRNILMILNRAVCIDYPEFDVPWFHTKYCEEMQTLVPKHTGSFYLDVEKKLNQLIKNKGYLKTNSFSPYGYKLDFEIILNNSKQAYNSLNEKIILLLLNEKDLRKTDSEMRGISKLKQRHLEMLGYRVIWIKKPIWNSMFMTEPEAKLSYLTSLIWLKP